jgi:hypothetical protein
MINSKHTRIAPQQSDAPKLNQPQKSFFQSRSGGHPRYPVIPGVPAAGGQQQRLSGSSQTPLVLPAECGQ